MPSRWAPVVRSTKTLGISPIPRPLILLFCPIAFIPLPTRTLTQVHMAIYLYGCPSYPHAPFAPTTIPPQFAEPPCGWPQGHHVILDQPLAHAHTWRVASCLIRSWYGGVTGGKGREGDGGNEAVKGVPPSCLLLQEVGIGPGQREEAGADDGGARRKPIRRKVGAAQGDRRHHRRYEYGTLDGKEMKETPGPQCRAEIGGGWTAA